MRFRRPLLFAACAVLLAAVGASVGWFCHRRAPASPQLATPELALARLASVPGIGKTPLFFTPAAAGFLKPEWRKWEAGEAAADPGALAREFESAAQNPKAWRALDRKYRFAALLLMGDPASYRPLLEHLRQSPDWTLTYLDLTSLIFERSPARAWTPGDLAPLKAVFKTHSTAERVAMRVQTAHRLAAIGRFDLANGLLTEALAADPDSSPAWTEVACGHAALGQWNKALTASERAVKADKNYLPALAAKANALFAFGKFDEALAITRRLVTEAPGNTPDLYLHARVTHAAHAYQEEIEALRKLIALAGANGLPTGSWRVYLAQAYAANGQARESLEQFQAAAKDPGLTARERSFVEKGIRRIEGDKGGS